MTPRTVNIRPTADLRLFVLDGRATPSIDVTAAAMLVQLRSDLQRDGSDLALAEGIGQVRDVLARVGVEGEPELFTTLDDAVGPGHTPGHMSGRTSDRTPGRPARHGGDET